MKQVKKLDFSGTTIFCGIDVDKKSWRVNIQDSEFELEGFSQDADVVLLHTPINRKYPGAAFKLCYEAGYSGFSTPALAKQPRLKINWLTIFYYVYQFGLFRNDIKR